MDTSETGRPSTLDEVAGKHPAWVITRTESPRGWQASRHQSATAARYVYGNSLADLDAKLDAAESTGPATSGR